MAKIKTLRRCRLFRSLSYRDLAVLAPYMREESCKSSDWITVEGKPSRGLFVLKQGEIKIGSLKDDSAALPVNPGDFFGELSLVDGDQTYAVGSQASGPCEYLRLDPVDYRTLATRSPDVAGKIAQGIAEALSQKVVGVRPILNQILESKG